MKREAGAGGGVRTALSKGGTEQKSKRRGKLAAGERPLGPWAHHADAVDVRGLVHDTGPRVFRVVIPAMLRRLGFAVLLRQPRVNELCGLGQGLRRRKRRRKWLMGGRRVVWGKGMDDLEAAERRGKGRQGSWRPQCADGQWEFRGSGRTTEASSRRMFEDLTRMCGMPFACSAASPRTVPSAMATR